MGREMTIHHGLNIDPMSYPCPYKFANVVHGASLWYTKCLVYFWIDPRQLFSM
jgi:hypothetical protein